MRRTKEQAQRTRRRIIAAARAMFARRGVTRTSLERIARAARVTRGAIYWHFANKTELFYAMRQEVSLPLMDCIVPRLERAGDALEHVEQFLLEVLRAIERDACARQTLEIVSFKCEYVNGLERALQEQAGATAELYSALLAAYRRARRARTLKRGLLPEAAAMETCAFLSGLVRLWLLDRAGSLPLRRQAQRVIAAHVRAKRA